MATQTFTYTGSEQTWVVPANAVSPITIECWGAQGGGGYLGGAGGAGGYAKGNLTVTPGETLRIYVGGQGGTPVNYANSSAGAAGWNGGGGTSTDSEGGAAGGGGGGASDLRQGGAALANRKIVAAGGGGGGGQRSSSVGGAGGDTTGQSGANGASNGGRGGGGGTQSQGGAGGAVSNQSHGAAGSLAQGGSGGLSRGDAGGGAGGGGYYGGGGGSSSDDAWGSDGGGGGGGGSNYVSGLTSTTSTQGTRTGNGQVTITYTINEVPTTAAVAPADNAAVNLTEGVNFQWTYSDPEATTQSAWALKRTNYDTNLTEWWRNESAWTESLSTTTIATSTASTTTAYSNQRKIDRCQNGVLWVLKNEGSSAGGSFYYSTDNGQTWNFDSVLNTGSSSYTSNASFFIDLDDYAHVVYKSSFDGFIYYKRGTPTDSTRTAWIWSAATTIRGDATASYPDLIAHREGTGWMVHIVASLTDASNGYVMYDRITITAGNSISSTYTPNMTTIGPATGNTNHTWPSIDFNHTGDGKTVAGGTPHLYVAWSAGVTGSGKGIRFRKCNQHGTGMTGSSTTSGARSGNGLVTFTLPDTSTASFSYTGSEQTYLVPAGVTSLAVDMYGGAGGGSAGGLGGRVQGTIAVTPGETLRIIVAGAGQRGDLGGAGGYGGGGNTFGGSTASGGGGGASQIWRSGQLLALAAGGGGMGNSGTTGGAGGGTTGGNGTGGVSPGSGGTQTAGGTSNSTVNGFYLQGGTGYNSGGGGGGGLYGGAGGGYGTSTGGGGGGSSYMGNGTTAWDLERQIDSAKYFSGDSRWLTCMFDGTRVIMPSYVDGGGVDLDLVIYERDASDTMTVTRTLLDDPASSLRMFYGSSTHDSDGNIYIFGTNVDEASGSRDLVYRKWTRSGASLSDEVIIDSGVGTPNISAKRGYSGGKIEFIYTDGTGSPYNVFYGKAAELSSGWTSSETYNNGADTSITISDWPSDDATYTWAVATKDAAGLVSSYTTARTLNPYEWWNATTGAWVYTETKNTSTSSTLTIEMDAGNYQWSAATEDQSGAKSSYATSQSFEVIKYERWGVIHI